MKDIIEAKDLPQSENIYMKHSFGEWRVVYPIKNSDGSINWFNLVTGGSWLKFFTWIVIILVILGAAYEYTSNTQYCNEIINSINNYTNIKLYPNNNLNLSLNYYPNDI